MGSPEEVGSSAVDGPVEGVGSAAVDGPVEGVVSIVGARSPNGVGSLRLSGSWTLLVLQCEPENINILAKFKLMSASACMYVCSLLPSQALTSVRLK